MSGTTTQLSDPGLLAGIGALSIGGTLFNCNDPTYSCSTLEYESKLGYNGFHGRTGKYIAAFIAAKIRDAATFKVSDFQNMTSVEVILTLANGKVITGNGMCCMKAVEVDANEAEFDVRFEGASVTEA
jgi:hypothetical protein